MKSKISIIAIIHLLFLAACNNPLVMIENTPIPLPESGKAIVYGKVLSNSGGPLKNTPIRLAEIYRGEDGSGAFALDEAFSPATMSDENGIYLFSNIPPGEYVLFIGSINTNFMIHANPDLSAIVYEVGSNESLEIETVTVNFD